MRKKQVPSTSGVVTFIALAVGASVSLSCLGEESVEQGRGEVIPEPATPEEAVAAPPEVVVTDPPPIAEPFTTDAEEWVGPEPVSRILEALSRGTPGTISVHRVRIDELTGLTRKGPSRIDSFEETLIYTRASASILETVCGAAETSKVEFYYLGGVLESGHSGRASTTPKLAVGDERVIVLEKLDGDYFLTRGSYRVFGVGTGATVSDLNGVSLSSRVQRTTGGTFTSRSNAKSAAIFSRAARAMPSPFFRGFMYARRPPSASLVTNRPPASPGRTSPRAPA